MKRRILLPGCVCGGAAAACGVFSAYPFSTRWVFDVFGSAALACFPLGYYKWNTCDRTVANRPPRVTRGAPAQDYCMDYCFLAAREAETHKRMVSCPAHTCVRCPVSPAPRSPAAQLPGVVAWCRSWTRKRHLRPCRPGARSARSFGDGRDAVTRFLEVKFVWAAAGSGQ